jgi:LCP family protein required for cell wall assembly
MGVSRLAALGLAVTMVAGCSGDKARAEKGLVVGASTTTSEAAPGPTIPPDPTTTTVATSPPATGATAPTGPAVAPPPLGFPDGSPYGPAVAFSTAVPVPQDLVFILAIGSDARPGQDMRRTNGDSLHLIGVDPRTGAGTVLGFPRDSWVEIPGKGTRKINSALSLGGPQLMAETVRKLTGLPVHYYVVTGFDGFQRIVDDLGGVNVNVDRKMRDKFSGAMFDPGWHNMNGGEALAYSRNRHDTQNGDFDRSLHQGNVMLSALAKLRAEVGDDAGIQRWIGVLLKYADLDSPPQQLTQLATLARNIDPSKITNVVVPGRVGTAGGGQSVVFLGEEARQIFIDLRPDAAIGGPKGDEPRPAAAAAAPTPTPTPEPAPAPAPDTTTTTAPPATTTTTIKPILGVVFPY